MRDPFILFKRSSGLKAERWYVSFWEDSAGDYVGRRSVQALRRELAHDIPATASSRAGSRLIVEAWLRTHSPARSVSIPLAIDYLMAFWDPDGAYVRGKAARGKDLSAQYVQNSAKRIEKYMKPFLEREPKPVTLDRLGAGILERFALELYEAEISPATANQVLAAVGKPLAEAVRLGLLPANPMASIEKLAEEAYVREPLTADEARRFFALPWADPRLRAVNLLAATTGMRLGECQGLLVEDIKADSIHVCHNWQAMEGLKGPKGSKGTTIIRSRDVPLPETTGKVLRELASRNPWNNGFVFFGTTDDRPINENLIRASHYAALEAIGIDEAARKARGLSFHSWRHFYNSRLRGQVADHALRAMTGHRSEAMTDRYTEITSEQREAVLRLAGEIV